MIAAATGAPRRDTALPGDVLVAEGLVHRYGELVAVDEVSFRIAPGETFGLLGPNGAGKTTTISMIAGLIPAHEGSVTVAGTSMQSDPVAAKGHLGLVPQELAIYPELSARENLLFFGRLQRMRGRELDRRVGEVLQLIGLEDRAKSPTKEYSGGMKRRLNIGIGLLHRPSLLVLDEPTVGVDPQSRNAILESVEALASEGMAVLYTTHYMEEAERLADTVAVVDRGRVVAHGTPAELVAGAEDGVRFNAPPGLDLRSLEKALPEGSAAREALPGSYVVTGPMGPQLLATVTAWCAAHGVMPDGLGRARRTLEDVFLELTGKDLR
jgi:ABC-2 type transport system ATP-binding protein